MGTRIKIDVRKRVLREQLLAARWAMTEAERISAHRALSVQIRRLVQRQQPKVVAAYVPIGTEPLAPHGEQSLPELLLSSASEAGELAVLLPIWKADNELGWAYYRGPESLQLTSRGLLEPTQAALPPDEIVKADLVLVPALAVDTAGNRLGRGAGCYDRALRYARAPIAALLYEHELLDEVPVADHDIAVASVITPSGWRPVRT